MSTLGLACNQCGAPLDVPASAQYASCAHCGSRLAIRRNATAAWTEVAERLVGETSRVADGVTLLTLQAELERLDREWQMQQPVPSQKGHGKDASDDTLGTLLGLAIPLFALYLIFGRGEIVPSFVFLLLMVAGVGIAMKHGAFGRWTGHRLSPSDYERRRAELVRRIEEAGGALPAR